MNRMVVAVEKEPLAIQAPILSAYNDCIRPLLDCIEKLRNLKITQEGIQLPTNVVVGDQSSGKSSVLESLAGISLPRGQGICTRVPLIMRLQNNPAPDHPELRLEFDGGKVLTDESRVAEATSAATDEIAGRNKGISKTPLTLIVKKNGVPDLTMIDLPGITRVPTDGQPEDICEQILGIITDYITPEESIILNVLSADFDFTTCESIRMSRRVDKTGERTLAVVTKADKNPKGLLEKVIADDVKIGLGYVCVRNRIDDESYEDARAQEAALFETHPLLSKISQSMVSIPVLAQKLALIQASIIAKCIPDIIRKINDKLGANMADLNKLPQNLTTVAEAWTTFTFIVSSGKESLRKITIRGEFDEYPDEKNMHCTARLAEILNQYSEKLQNSMKIITSEPRQNFLQEEIEFLEEAKGVTLPNFLPRTAFLAYLQKMVKAISATPVEFVEKVWDYLEGAIIQVLLKHCENYPQLQSPIKRAAQNLIGEKKRQSFDWVMQIMEMEKFSDFTCSPEYMSTWHNLMAQENEFMLIMKDHYRLASISIDGFGKLEVGHLRNHPHLVANQAFDLKMRMTAYWKIVLTRLVDFMALHIQISIQNLVNKEIDTEIVKELTRGGNGGIERMLLEESPIIAEKRYRLKSSIVLLKEAKEIVATITEG